MINKMELKELLKLCRAFSDLGDAASSQLEGVANGEALEDQNPNALRLADQRFLALAEAAGVDGVAEIRQAIRPLFALNRKH